ncbi:MAG: hypothetical protein WCO23_04250 [bacterium]
MLNNPQLSQIVRQTNLTEMMDSYSEYINANEIEKSQIITKLENQVVADTNENFLLDMKLNNIGEYFYFKALVAYIHLTMPIKSYTQNILNSQYDFATEFGKLQKYMEFAQDEAEATTTDTTATSETTTPTSDNTQISPLLGFLPAMPSLTGLGAQSGSSLLSALSPVVAPFIPNLPLLTRSIQIWVENRNLIPKYLQSLNNLIFSKQVNKANEYVDLVAYLGEGHEKAWVYINRWGNAETANLLLEDNIGDEYRTKVHDFIMRKGDLATANLVASNIASNRNTALASSLFDLIKKIKSAEPVNTLLAPFSHAITQNLSDTLDLASSLGNSESATILANQIFSHNQDLYQNSTMEIIFRLGDARTADALVEKLATNDIWPDQVQNTIDFILKTGDENTANLIAKLLISNSYVFPSNLSPTFLNYVLNHASNSYHEQLREIQTSFASIKTLHENIIQEYSKLGLPFDRVMISNLAKITDPKILLDELNYLRLPKQQADTILASISDFFPMSIYPSQIQQKQSQALSNLKKIKQAISNYQISKNSADLNDIAEYCRQIPFSWSKDWLSIEIVQESLQLLPQLHAIGQYLSSTKEREIIFRIVELLTPNLESQNTRSNLSESRVVSYHGLDESPSSDNMSPNTATLESPIMSVLKTGALLSRKEQRKELGRSNYKTYKSNDAELNQISFGAEGGYNSDNNQHVFAVLVGYKYLAATSQEYNDWFFDKNFLGDDIDSSPGKRVDLRKDPILLIISSKYKSWIDKSIEDHFSGITNYKLWEGLTREETAAWLDSHLIIDDQYSYLMRGQIEYVLRKVYEEKYTINIGPGKIISSGSNIIVGGTIVSQTPGRLYLPTSGQGITVQENNINVQDAWDSEKETFGIKRKFNGPQHVIDTVRINIAKTIQGSTANITNIASQNKVNPEQLIADVQEKINSIVNNSSYFRASTVDEIVSILTDNSHKFKSLFETKSSHFNYAPTERAQKEHDLFGYPNDPKDATIDRPIYGYFSDNSLGGINHKSINPNEIFPTSLSHYGPVIVKFKNDIISRTTITFHDSLGQPQYPPSLAIQPSIVSKKIRNIQSILDFNDSQHTPDYIGDTSINDSYTEAQFHGGVTTDDIESIILVVNNGLSENDIAIIEQAFSKFKVQFPSSTITLNIVYPSTSPLLGFLPAMPSLTGLGAQSGSSLLSALSPVVAPFIPNLPLSFSP